MKFWRAELRNVKPAAGPVATGGLSRLQRERRSRWPGPGSSWAPVSLSRCQFTSSAPRMDRAPGAPPSGQGSLSTFDITSPLSSRAGRCLVAPQPIGLLASTLTALQRVTGNPNREMVLRERPQGRVQAIAQAPS